MEDTLFWISEANQILNVKSTLVILTELHGWDLEVNFRIQASKTHLNASSDICERFESSYEIVERLVIRTEILLCVFK